MTAVVTSCISGADGLKFCYLMGLGEMYIF